MHPEIIRYHASLAEADQEVCQRLAGEIEHTLPQAEGKVWHGSPVWFLEGNPIVGYSKQKRAVQLLFWSGQSFDEPGLAPVGKHKAAEALFSAAGEIDLDQLVIWLHKAASIQWDYKNIVKRNGELIRLK